MEVVVHILQVLCFLVAALVIVCAGAALAGWTRRYVRGGRSMYGDIDRQRKREDQKVRKLRKELRKKNINLNT